MSEEWFWDTELRIVWNLIEEKKKIDEVRMKNQAIYTACYVWGKDPDEGKEKEIPGIDKPVDEKALSQFFL